MHTRPVVVLAAALGAVAASPARAETSADLSRLVEPARADRADTPVAPPMRATERDPTLRIGRPTVPARRGHLGHTPPPTIARAAIALTLSETTVAARVTLTLAAAPGDTELAEAVIALEVPRGARVTGLTIHAATGPQDRDTAALAIATARPAADALADYRRTVELVRDPALLAWTGVRAGHDQLALHVFPIAPRAPATVELALELPRGQRVILDPGGQSIAEVEVDVDGTRAQWAAVHARRAIALGDAPGRPDHTIDSENVLPPVDRETSLFAGVPTARARPTFDERPLLRPRYAQSPNVGGKASIRGVVHVHGAQLRRCYMLAAQGKPTLAGSVVLDLAIARDGSVVSSSSHGDLDDASVHACVEAEAATWQFPADDGMLVVHYPLQFQLAQS